jgi:hypothetical protein
MLIIMATPRYLDYVRESQDLNEQLYGRPDDVIHDQLLGEIFAQASEKDLNKQQQKALMELKDGFQVEVDGETVDVPPIGFSEGQDRMPKVKSEIKEKYTSVLHAMFPDTYALVNEYYQAVILMRPADQQVFYVDDIIVLFNTALARRDPNRESGVRVILDKGSSSLAWSTPDLAVKIGATRDPIESVEAMASLIAHELDIHAGATINGFRYENPILGMGIFTEADEGETSDYLTSEEGKASLAQQMLDGKRQEWDSTTISKHLAIGLAYQGLDYRQAYEILCRVRMITNYDGQDDISNKEMSKIKDYSEKAVMRVFRGTPTRMPRLDDKGKPIVMTFNKDLAYLNGTIRVLRWLENATEAEIREYLLLKADPTNKYHRAIVEHITRSSISETTI